MGRDVEGILTTSAAANIDCEILDLPAGRRLGTSPGRRLTVRAIACPLTVHGWERNQIGVKVEGDYHLDTQASTPLVQSQVDTHSIAIFVPRGVELELLADEGSLSIERTIGRVHAKIPEGSLQVSHHEGSLRIHAAGQGSVSIHGLKSDYFEVRARSGSVSISELELTRGRGQVETECGSVALRPTASASFRYYLESVSGTLQGPASGHVGQGTGWLTVRTTGGTISMVRRPAPRPGQEDSCRSGGRGCRRGAMVFRPVRFSIRKDGRRGRGTSRFSF